MENASKALIIAGSVLIAILLISLGLVIFNSTSGVTDQATKLGETLEDSTFNSQFLKYCGSGVKGDQVLLLLDYIMAYNGKNDPDINVTKASGEPTLSSIRNSIITVQIYTVEPVDSDTNGRIDGITISP